MSAKSHFLKKLQARQTLPGLPVTKHQADIATFRSRMTQLQEQMAGWLVDTGIEVQTIPVSVTDLLVEGGAFDVPGLVLRYENQAVKFLPVFLYGQGVTGCVEITLQTGEHLTVLGRLYRRAGNVSVWMYAPKNDISPPQQMFDEDTFFRLITALLPQQACEY